MLQNTFQILDRVGNRKEESFWEQGIHNWNNFLGQDEVKGLSGKAKYQFDRQLKEAKHHLHTHNSSYFQGKLPSTETWRLFEEFASDVVYLDIETDGLGSWADITVMGLYDGINTKSMIKGINLDYEVLKKELQKYKLIVTFNGASFDLPFIRKRYDILPDIPHIDLRHCCARLGLRGGLKNIEKHFNIGRRDLVEGMHGGDALTLWKMYKATGDEHYINLLVEYNEEDVINLKKIMRYCYEKLSESVFHKFNKSLEPELSGVEPC